MLTISFWIRPEDEAFDESIYLNNYKRILSFSKDSSSDYFNIGYKGNMLDVMQFNTFLNQYVSILDKMFDAGINPPTLFYCIYN